MPEVASEEQTLEPRQIPVYVKPPDVAKVVIQRILNNWRIGERKVSGIVKNVESLCRTTRSMVVRHVDVYAILYNHAYGKGVLGDPIEDRVPGANGELNLMQFKRFYDLWRLGNTYESCVSQTISFTQDKRDDADM